MTNRYTSDGTIFYKDSGKIWAVQIDYNYGGGGAPFKTIKWATWKNENVILSLQETNEPPDMWGWKVATQADIVLYATPEIANNINNIQKLIELGYKGRFSTKEDINELKRKLANG